MLKMLFAFLIVIEVSMIPLMIYCLSGFNIFLPGMGLIISSEFVFVLLLVVEIGLLAATYFLYHHLRRDSGILN